MPLRLFHRFHGIAALLDRVHHLAEVDEFVADDFIVLVEGNLGDIAFGHLQIARALGLGGKHGADLASEALAEILRRSADGKAVLGEGGLAAAVDDLQEQLAHGGVDGVADEVGVERLENGLADQDLGGHGGGMGHAGAAQGLHETLFNDAVLDVERQLAGTLLRSAPAHTVRETGDVLDFLGLNPFTLFRDRRRSVIRALRDRAHMLYFCSVNHKILPF